MSRSSLRRELVFPIIALVIGVSAAIGWVSMKAGTDAVNTLTQRILTDMVNRISHATERHLDSALVVIDAIAPDRLHTPTSQTFSDNLSTLESKLWTASGLFMDVNNYVYYGGEDGRTVGVFRVKPDWVEVYWREPRSHSRKVYQATAPGDRSVLLRTDHYDPRVRPWYRAAIASDKPVWTKIYNDFTSAEPTVTLAKAVFQPDHTLVGVVATDVTLKMLSDFLRTLEISKNSVAYIIDSEGYIVASSGDELTVKRVNDAPERLLASEMKTPLISEIYKRSYDWQQRILRGDQSMLQTQSFNLSTGTVDVAVAALGNKQGLKWLTVVAVPRSDFMSSVNKGFFESFIIAIAFVVVALTIGLTMVGRVIRDIRRLTRAAEKFGDGQPLPDLKIDRDDEIGSLAQTLIEMEKKLRFDKLTQVANRESLFAQISYLQKNARNNPNAPNGQDVFTILFVDLDRFKFINDNYGHDAGDAALIIIAARLKAAIRDTDTVARYGGDEFVLLLKDTKSSIDIHQMVEKISTLVEMPIALDDIMVSVGVSVGWACFPEDGDDYVRLIKIADSRMYNHKRDRKTNQMHLV